MDLFDGNDELLWWMEDSADNDSCLNDSCLWRPSPPGWFASPPSEPLPDFTPRTLFAWERPQVQRNVTTSSACALCASPVAGVCELLRPDCPDRTRRALARERRLERDAQQRAVDALLASIPVHPGWQPEPRKRKKKNMNGRTLVQGAAAPAPGPTPTAAATPAPGPTPTAAALPGPQPESAPLRKTLTVSAPLRNAQPESAPLRKAQPVSAPLRKAETEALHARRCRRQCLAVVVVLVVVTLVLVFVSSPRATPVTLQKSVDEFQLASAPRPGEQPVCPEHTHTPRADRIRAYCWGLSGPPFRDQIRLNASRRSCDRGWRMRDSALTSHA